MARIIATGGGENKQLAVGGRGSVSPSYRPSCYLSSGMECACLIDEGRRPMKMIAYLLAIICVIAAVMYFVMPAGQLPTFMPGYLAGSAHIHTTHAIAAAVAAVVLFVLGWILGRR